MSEDTKKLERTIKAVKIVVMDLKKKVGELAEEMKGHEENRKKQNDQLQKLAKAVEAAVDKIKSKEQMVPAGFDPKKLKELDTKFESETKRLNQIEKQLGKFGQTLTTVKEDVQGVQQRPEGIDPERLKELDAKIGSETERIDQIDKRFENLTQTLTALTENIQGVQHRLEELDAPTPADTDRLDKIEAMHGEVETKLVTFRGKLADIEDSLTSLKATTTETPKITEIEQLADIEKRFGDFDQTLTTLKENIQVVQQCLEELGTPAPTDTDRLDKIETEQNELEIKLATIRGKQVEIEETITALKAAEPGTPVIADTKRLDQIENIVGDFDQTLVTLKEEIRGFHKQIEELGAPTPTDTDRLDKIEAMHGEVETKLVTFRGKLAEIEDTLTSLKAVAPEALSIDSNEIFKRLDALENLIPQIKPTAPVAQPATVSAPTPSPPSEITPKPAVEVDIGGLTMKEKVQKIIEELVTASAITIASRLQVSTARIHGIIRELESDGVVKISGDIETGRYEVRLA